MGFHAIDPWDYRKEHTMLPIPLHIPQSLMSCAMSVTNWWAEIRAIQLLVLWMVTGIPIRQTYNVLVNKLYIPRNRFWIINLVIVSCISVVTCEGPGTIANADVVVKSLSFEGTAEVKCDESYLIWTWNPMLVIYSQLFCKLHVMEGCMPVPGVYHDMCGIISTSSSAMNSEHFNGCRPIIWVYQLKHVLLWACSS